MRLPVPLIAPAKVPKLKVSAVVFKFTAPLPVSDWMVTAGFSKFTDPFACKSVEAEISEPSEPERMRRVSAPS